MKKVFATLAAIASLSVFAVAQQSTVSPQQQIQHANKEFLEAMAQQDIAAFDQHVDDNAIITDNVTSTKAQMREGLIVAKRDKRYYFTIKNTKVLGVRVHGDNAVIVGRVWGVDGVQKHRRFAFTNVFIQRQKDWKLIAGHYSN